MGRAKRPSCRCRSGRRRARRAPRGRAGWPAPGWASARCSPAPRRREAARASARGIRRTYLCRSPETDRPAKDWPSTPVQADGIDNGIRVGDGVPAAGWPRPRMGGDVNRMRTSRAPENPLYPRRGKNSQRNLGLPWPPGLVRPIFTNKSGPIRHAVEERSIRRRGAPSRMGPCTTESGSTATPTSRARCSRWAVPRRCLAGRREGRPDPPSPASPSTGPRSSSSTSPPPPTTAPAGPRRRSSRSSTTAPSTC